MQSPVTTDEVVGVSGRFTFVKEK